jgi:hypothetical protein
VQRHGGKGLLNGEEANREQKGHRPAQEANIHRQRHATEQAQAQIVEAIPGAGMSLSSDSIQHSGGMCDPAEFHAAIDKMTDEAAADVPELTWDETRKYVLLTVLWLLNPAGNA